MRACKRAIDMIGAGVGLAVFAPLLLAIAAAVKLTDGGPVLFWQTRVGQGGRRFRMVKFRTMRPGAERMLAGVRSHQGAGTLFKLREDPRVTPLGRHLRRWSLDELPQLWNVLVGDMSLVGPRPPLPAETDRYTPAQRRRLTVRPGLTGLWQVSGRSDLSVEAYHALDGFYVDRWSLGYDLTLLARTVRAVFAGWGAY